MCIHAWTHTYIQLAGINTRQTVQKVTVKMAIRNDKLGEKKCPLTMMKKTYPGNVTFVISKLFTALIISY
jgi:hypothetical protein